MFFGVKRGVKNDVFGAFLKIFQKNEKNFEKGVDKWKELVYNSQALTSRDDLGECNRSLKIEQYEISSTEKCEISLKKHFEKRNSKK